MRKRLYLSLGAVVSLGVGALALTLLTGAAEPKAAADAPKTAPSRITAVTVYQNTALVTREVDVPDGAGTVELIVTPLPDATVEGTLYSEGSDSIRVLTTRFRNRAIKEDTREEVRKLEAEHRKLQTEAQKLKGDVEALKQNMGLLTKMEGFTQASTQHATEKGNLNSDSAIALSKYVMEERATKAKEMVELEQKMQTNAEQAAFVQRQLQELAAGSSKTERDAVIIVDKKNGGAGKVRLNYLVGTANWRPQYKLRAGKDKDAVQLEYLAAVTQQSGEDWKDAKITLSTAEPMLNSAPPDLKTLEFTVLARGGMPPGAQPIPNLPGMQPPGDFGKAAKDLRGQAAREYSQKKESTGGQFINDAAALEQCFDLFNPRDHQAKLKGPGGPREGQSVTYHLNSKLTVPSRSEEQVIEVARLELAPDYFYKAVPVLTPHVYRLANLTNKSQYVLLPGEATTYLGSDFVGQMNMPLVAIDEQFTAGFGVDPALRVQRQMMDKSRETKGGNQVLKFEFRILVSSYKSEPVSVQVWDRLPHAESETAGITLVKAEPEVSADALYVREERPNNLLRWDIKVDPTMNGEKARAVKYEFKLEMDKQMIVGNVQTK
ncbi:MAG TPA: mucoidy inhibitor MuiA family protein [Gemmataceae bacterium]|nr:mucoidy inhibitor MuiA family protein [Gemmataceae bacterium]